MEDTSLEMRVSVRRNEAAGICSFELVHSEGKPLPAFSAGAHVDVHLENGLTRQYSLCNDPGERHRYLIAVLRDPATRGGSSAMHDSVLEGDLLRISAPKNHFPLAQNAMHSLLLAGGIGVTPILSMAEWLARMGASFEMHYCARSRERAAFHQRINASSFASRVKYHFDDDALEPKLDVEALLAEPKPGVHRYVCGPKGFIDAVLSTARTRGWQEDQLHCEFFAGAALTSADDTGFNVKLASSGNLVAVAKEQSVVQALAAVGIEVETSCEQGVCGTCLTRVLEGEPDHRDLYLTQEEREKNNQFLPCCSRSRSAVLLLDL
jgi:vanillate monooxygenase ferredoxin subunit